MATATLQDMFKAEADLAVTAATRLPSVTDPGDRAVLLLELADSMSRMSELLPVSAAAAELADCAVNYTRAAAAELGTLTAADPSTDRTTLALWVAAARSDDREERARLYLRLAAHVEPESAGAALHLRTIAAAEESLAAANPAA